MRAKDIIELIEDSAYARDEESVREVRALIQDLYDSREIDDIKRAVGSNEASDVALMVNVQRVLHKHSSDSTKINPEIIRDALS